MISITTIVIIVIILVIVSLIGLFWYISYRNKRRFPFILYSGDGIHSRIVHATITTDPSNKLNKKFQIQKLNNAILPIREATRWHDGRPYREIAQNSLGEYSYLDGFKIDKSEYLSYNLDPEEKSITLSRLKENQSRYENPMNKAQAILMFGSLLLILLLGIGIVYSTIQYVKVSANMVTISKENNAIATQNRAVSESNALVTEQLVMVAAALTGDLNLTRQIK